MVSINSELRQTVSILPQLTARHLPAALRGNILTYPKRVEGGADDLLGGGPDIVPSRHAGEGVAHQHLYEVPRQAKLDLRYRTP